MGRELSGSPVPYHVQAVRQQNEGSTDSVCWDTDAMRGRSRLLGEAETLVGRIRADVDPVKVADDATMGSDDLDAVCAAYGDALVRDLEDLGLAKLADNVDRTAGAREDAEHGLVQLVKRHGL